MCSTGNNNNSEDTFRPFMQTPRK